MQLTLQATLSCHACGRKGNPVNAVVSRVPCLGCGAMLSLPDPVWTGALEGVRMRATDLAENARGHETLRTAGGEFRVGYARITPSCPHCQADWNAVPESECPSCKLPVSRRPAPFAIDGIEALVAEDRALVLGDEEAGMNRTVSCSSCGAPLELGAERKVQCNACDATTVVPDEQWRRSNAPELTANWVAVVDAEGTDNPLAGIGISHMAVGPDGTVFVVGSAYPMNVMVMAMDPGLTRRLWTHEIHTDGAPYPVPLPDGRVALVPDGMPGPDERTVRVADAGGVQTLFEFPDGPEIVDGAVQGDTLVLARGHHRQLHRYDFQGNPLPVWPPVGFFARLFSGDGPAQPAMTPTARPIGTMTGRMGSGHDGALLFAWGPNVVRYDAEGAIVWKHENSDWLACLSAPAGARDGKAAFCFSIPHDGTTAFQVFTVGPDGSPAEPLFERDSIHAIAVTPNGEVLVYCGDFIEDVGVRFELMVIDAEGNTVRTLPVGW